MEKRDDGLEQAWADLLAGERLAKGDEQALVAALDPSASQRSALVEDAELDGILRALGWAHRDEEAVVRGFSARVAAEGDAARFVSSVQERTTGASARATWSTRARRLLLPVFVPVAVLAAAVAVLVPGLKRSTGDGVVAEPSGADPALPITDNRPGVPGTPGPRAAPAAIARVEDLRGTVFRLQAGLRASLQAGDQLLAGDGLVTIGRASAAMLRYPDGTHVEIGADTTVAQAWDASTASSPPPAPGKRLFVAVGSLLAQVSPQPAGQPMVLSSPHAEATVVGTRLRWQVSPASTRLDVEEGRVRLAAHGAPNASEVTAGHHAVARVGAAALVIENARGGRVLLVGGNAVGLNDGSDGLVRKRLETLGFEVRVHVPGSQLAAAELQAQRLIVISSTTGADDLGVSMFRELAVPVLTWESRLYDDLGMTGPCDDGDCGDDKSPHGVFIKDPAHPLAAGLSGVVVVEKQDNAFMHWGTPNTYASWVGTMPGHPTKAVIFAYESGAQMPGLVAPARRAGIFLTDTAPRRLTEAGWTLFDAAVRWCTDSPAGR